MIEVSEKFVFLSMRSKVGRVFLFFPQSVLVAAGLKLAKTCLTAATPDHLVSDFLSVNLLMIAAE